MADRSPSAHSRGSDVAFVVLTMVSAAMMMALIHLVLYVAPVEATMGIVQKIFYFHVPAAYAMYLGAFVCAVGSALYLAKGELRYDALAKAGAETAVAMGFIVLITGPLWAAKAWGVYWTWDPRLTTSMLSVLIYIAYVVLRAFAGNGEAERKFGAALGVIGAANLPIIHYSVQKWGGNHPKVISTGGGGLHDPSMKMCLGLGFLTFTVLTIVILVIRVRDEMLANRFAEVEDNAIDLGIDGDAA